MITFSAMPQASRVQSIRTPCLMIAWNRPTFTVDNTMRSLLLRSRLVSISFQMLVANLCTTFVLLSYLHRIEIGRIVFSFYIRLSRVVRCIFFVLSELRAIVSPVSSDQRCW